MSTEPPASSRVAIAWAKPTVGRLSVSVIVSVWLVGVPRLAPTGVASVRIAVSVGSLIPSSTSVTVSVSTVCPAGIVTGMGMTQ